MRGGARPHEHTDRGLSSRDGPVAVATTGPGVASNDTGGPFTGVPSRTGTRKRTARDLMVGRPTPRLGRAGISGGCVTAASRVVPLLSKLLRVRSRGAQPLRCMARQLAYSSADCSMSSISSGWIRSRPLIAPSQDPSQDPLHDLFHDSLRDPLSARLRTQLSARFRVRSRPPASSGIS